MTWPARGFLGRLPPPAALILCAAIGASPPPAADGIPPLVRAAGSGDIALMERLFLQGEGLGRAGADGRTALHAAAAAGKDEAVEWLLAHEANVFAKDKSGKTAADLTTELGLRTTSNILKKFQLLMSIEQAAVGEGAWGDLDEALARDARRWTLLHVLAMTGNVEEARKRLRAGGAVDARTAIGATPLMKAAVAGQLGTAKLLLESGADINASDAVGNTPLIAAVVGRSAEVAALLVEAGADLEARTRSGGGGTALQLAERMGRLKVARILREARPAK